MKIIFPMFVAPLILVWSISFGEGPAQSENLETTINYLLLHVEKSDRTFIRNDREYTAKEAAGHMRKKYAYFKSKIKTAEDFIRLSATKSLVSGKPYMVETKSGKLMTSETWLLEALETYRRSRVKNN
ncbi:MAG: DUF5329 family protein [Desulfobacterales bacterium]|nr:DUF5329 family protein [Desulfobacterales bacterium]